MFCRKYNIHIYLKKKQNYEKFPSDFVKEENQCL